MIDAVSGTTCPACGERLVSDDGWYVCEGCSERYEVTDMYMP